MTKARMGKILPILPVCGRLNDVKKERGKMKIE